MPGTQVSDPLREHLNQLMRAPDHARSVTLADRRIGSTSNAQQRRILARHTEGATVLYAIVGVDRISQHAAYEDSHRSCNLEHVSTNRKCTDVIALPNRQTVRSVTKI